MKGIVKFYSLVKGAGVIVGEDHKEYSFKMTDISGTGLRRLAENQPVTFTPNEHKASLISPEEASK